MHCILYVLSTYYGVDLLWTYSIQYTYFLMSFLINKISKLISKHNFLRNEQVSNYNLPRFYHQRYPNQCKTLSADHPWWWPLCSVSLHLNYGLHWLVQSPDPYSEHIATSTSNHLIRNSRIVLILYVSLLYLIFPITFHLPSMILCVAPARSLTYITIDNQQPIRIILLAPKCLLAHVITTPSTELLYSNLLCSPLSTNK